MPPSTLPHDESARLSALYELGVLYTPAEERFDRITRLVRRLLNVPIALISLVDAHDQWFKSASGTNLAGTSRALSICAQTILADETLIVPDTRLDSRISHNPLVTNEPHIRFYAGHPLKSPDGHNVGALCAVDFLPRELPIADLDMLVDLAGWAENELRVTTLSDAQRQLISELDVARRQALVDGLTRLWNHEAITDLLGREFARSTRESSQISVIMADIDHFKHVNDTWGHVTGDAALRETARLMRRCVRPYDAVGRYGGEEFLIVLIDCGRRLAFNIAQRIRQCIEQAEIVAEEHNRGEGRARVPLTLSLGVASSTKEDACDAMGLIRLADDALYRAKRGGRNRGEVATSEHAEGRVEHA